MVTVKGDLIEMAARGDFDMIVQGCNCFHVMGGGIARQLRERYPEVLEADKTSVRGDRSKLGSFTVAKTSDGFEVINAYTQYHFGEDPSAKDGVLADYDAIQGAFHRIKQTYGNKGIRFGIPMIGAGLARGDWSIISEIIKDEMGQEDLTLVLFEGGQ